MNPPDTIDLRSDTVTRPTLAMRVVNHPHREQRENRGEREQIRIVEYEIVHGSGPRRAASNSSITKASVPRYNGHRNNSV